MKTPRGRVGSPHFLPMLALLLLSKTASGEPGLTSGPAVALSGYPAQRAAAVSAISIQAPPVVNASEGDPVSIIAEAGSGDGRSIITIAAAGAPLELTFTTNTPTTIVPSAVLSGTLGPETAGTWVITSTATDQFNQVAYATTNLIVADTQPPFVNHAPVAEAGGPYSGLVGEAVVFDGSRSYDVDGDSLYYIWNFGDGGTGTGVSASYTYTSNIRYFVTLTVCELPALGAPNQLCDSDTTTALIATAFGANVFVTGGDRAVRLASAKPDVCVQVEPMPYTFHIEDVDLGSFEMGYGANSIHAIPGKVTLGPDTNRNGVEEITACFAKKDLRVLFAGLPERRNDVVVTITARHRAGNPISGTLRLTVVMKAGTVTASLSPNPFNPSAVLTFKMEKSGPVRVRLYDMNGRLVRTLLDLSDAAAGYQNVRVDDVGAGGERLASGVYFYRVETAEGEVVGRASILK